MQDKLNNINKLVEEIYALSIDKDENIVNLNKLEIRDSILGGLKKARGKLSKLISSLDNRIDSLETIHRNQLGRLKNALGETSRPETPWKVIAKGKERAITLEKVPITEHLFLPAIVVSHWKELKSMRDGVLYYVSSADNFAIKINGSLYYGNIGNIITNESNPTKIKDCKFGKECSKDKCNYYHDPMLSLDGSDRRNYVASSWVYSPPDDKARNKKKMRKFGSLNNLEIDMQLLKKDDINRFNSQTMHDLLCSLLIKKYKGND